jgi:endonuclease/exonuclease/phosphatase family metal-dependent hydrolase
MLVTTGGAAGWAIPNLPVVGPLVQRILGNEAWQEQLVDSIDGRLEEPVGKLQSKLSAAASDTPLAGVPSGTRPSSLSGSNITARSTDTVTVASFNIQVFGETKLSKSWVVNILAQVVRQFDVVAIQEIRSQKDHIIPQFVESVNADGSRYNYVIGPRLGRTVSTEQYAFIYDTQRIEIDTSSPGTIQDPLDQLHREPFVARFRARTAQSTSSFTFWLVNTHTDPDEVPTEVDALADVFLVMQQARPDEDDVILLGDLNASDTQFGRLGQIPGIAWAVRDTTTNTRRSKMYDNILFDHQRTAEYTGRWGVYDLEAAFQLTREQALAVSDHLPVWAEFSMYEAAAASHTAGLSGDGTRR